MSSMTGTMTDSGEGIGDDDDDYDGGGDDDKEARFYLAQKERGQVIMTSVIFSSGGNMSL